MMLSTMESSSTRTDVQTPKLVLRAQAGDVDAFTDIVTRYHRRIVGYIVGLVVDRHMADEIAQEVFLTAHQSLEKFDHRSSFVTWLIGIARNKSISALRRQSARRHREAIAGQQIIRNWELECAEASRSNQLDQIDALQLCIENLKPKHRELLDRRYQDNESIVSIAKTMNRQATSVRMIFMRLRTALAECVNRKTNLSSES